MTRLKHPIAWAFGVAVVVAVALAVALPYTRQEAPWALFFIGLAFPFIWFFAWLITNAMSWWQDTMTPGDDRTKGPPQ